MDFDSKAERLVSVLIALVAVLLAAGCGTGGLASPGGDTTRGKELFKSKCGGCHTLADAGTPGKLGPNLDNAFAADRKQGFKESTILEVVYQQIQYPGEKRPGDPTVQMPANLVTGDDADAVAAYVASVAGLPVTGGPGGKVTATGGKAIFAAARCNSCHTLKDAGSTATVGPDLDQKKPGAARVVRQVTNGGKAMPAFKGKLTKAQIKAVAEYVASVAGK